MGGSGLYRTDDFQKFCGSGLDQIYLSDQGWTRTKTFHSSLISAFYTVINAVWISTSDPVEFFSKSCSIRVRF